MAYERRTRRTTRPRFVPIRRLRLDISDHDAPDGTLRIQENLRPAGPVEAPYLTPVQPSTKILNVDTIGISGTPLAVSFQIRDSRGIYSSQSDSSLDRLLIVTSSHIYLYDKALTRLTEAYSFTSEKTDRKIQFATIGQTMFMSISEGDGLGTPEMVLQLRDDVVFDLNYPELPTIEATLQTTTDNDGLPLGVYAFRFAYELTDGSIGGASRPYILDARGNAFSNVRFLISRLPTISDNWKTMIRRVVIYMTVSALSDDQTEESFIPTLMASPFFEIASIDELQVGKHTDWSGSADVILSGLSLEDDNLMQHEIAAGSIFAYNNALLLGDVTYDFRKPVGDADVATPESVPPIIGGDSPVTLNDNEEAFYYIDVVDGAWVDSLTVSVDEPGYEYQIYGWTGTAWTAEGAVDTDFSDAGQEYSRMRVIVIQRTAVDDAIVNITATDDNSRSSQSAFFIYVFG